MERIRNAIQVFEGEPPGAGNVLEFIAPSPEGRDNGLLGRQTPADLDRSDDAFLNQPLDAIGHTPDQPVVRFPSGLEQASYRPSKSFQ